MQGTFALIEMLWLVVGIILLFVATWHTGDGIASGRVFTTSIGSTWSPFSPVWVRRLKSVGVPILVGVFMLDLAAYAVVYGLPPAWPLWAFFGLVFVGETVLLILLSGVADEVRSLVNSRNEGHETLRRVDRSMVVSWRLWAAAFLSGIGAGIARIALSVTTG